LTQQALSREPPNKDSNLSPLEAELEKAGREPSLDWLEKTPPPVA
jgi:hypothetical protein